MSSKSVALTSKQQNHTLAAKKKKQKKSFRYILADPFPRYWPQLSEEQSQHLFELLKDIQVANPQWLAGPKSTDEKRPIHFGLQSSTRKLQTGQMKLLVLSADLKPRYIANQIILLALGANEGIRILCVPNMKNVFEPILNFTCYAFVISAENLSRFAELDKWTANLIDKHFPVSPIIEAHFGNRRNKNQTCPPDAMDVDELEAQSCKQISSSIETVDFDQIYLTRKNCEPNRRAFVPNNAVNLKPIAFELESLNKIKSDFISLDTYDNSSGGPSTSQHPKYPNEFPNKKQKKKKTPLVLYKPLIVHKVQSNPNKEKKHKNKNKNKKNK